MSILFEPMALGKLQIKHRFVHSATIEGTATERGEVTDDLVRRYRILANNALCDFATAPGDAVGQLHLN